MDTAFATYIRGKRKEIQAARKQTRSNNNRPEMAEDILPPEPDDQPDPKGPNVAEVIAQEFGSAAIVRHLCDRVECGKPVTLGWKGRQGEYCSNNCLKLAEHASASNHSRKSQGESMTTAEIEVEENDATTDATPVTTPKKAIKQKKAVAKKAVAKKAAPAAKKAVAKKAAAATNGHASDRQTINNRRTIKLLKKASPCRPGTLRQQIVDLMKNDMTVAELQQLAVKATKTPSLRSRSVAILRWAEGEGLCRVVEPK